jgi:hypothetical protein
VCHQIDSRLPPEQSEVADAGRDRIVEPLAPCKRMAKLTGRLTPVVSVAGVERVLADESTGSSGRGSHRSARVVMSMDAFTAMIWRSIPTALALIVSQ